MFLLRFVVALSLLSTGSAVAQAPSVAKVPFRVHITLSPQAAQQPVSGRLIFVLTQSDPHGRPLDPGSLVPKAKAWIAACEVDSLAPNAAIDLDADQIAYPTPLSAAPAGHYWAMALLDRGHRAAYRFMWPGDLRSDVIELKSLDPAAGTPLQLSLAVRVPDDPAVRLPENAQLLDFASPALAKFWGRPIHIHGVVLLPPKYAASTERYPVVYWTHGFGGDLDYIERFALPKYASLLASGALPPMIYVFLDESCPGGTHEFADSVNNGPWGEALTRELVPYIDKTYRTMAVPHARFATGHSSGGWAALWLGVTYPEIFGAVWPTAPDPSDFRDFAGPNLRQRPPPNFYRNADGSARTFVRIGGRDITTFEDMVRQEDVLGQYGGQFASFEWVFSPRGSDGRPEQLFDRKTGVINTAVAESWEKYDIAEIIRKNADRLRPLLQDHIHLYVGTADTFHLEGPAHLLDETLKQLGIRAQFTFVPGRSHSNLYEGGLEEKIAKEMDAVAHAQPVR